MKRPALGLMLFAVPALVAGQSSTPPATSTPAPSAPAAPAAKAPPCATAEYRQFDFWLGEWSVESKGAPASQSRITRLFGDCGLREEYSTPSGYVGSSFNMYDAARQVWHQTWVDNSGALLVIEGGLKNGSMVLQGEHPSPKGGNQLDRITWTPNADGTVRQHWEVSTDQGKSWTSAFDGTYRRTK